MICKILQGWDYFPHPVVAFLTPEPSWIFRTAGKGYWKTWNWLEDTRCKGLFLKFFTWLGCQLWLKLLLDIFFQHNIGNFWRAYWNFQDCFQLSPGNWCWFLEIPEQSWKVRNYHRLLLTISNVSILLLRPVVINSNKTEFRKCIMSTV